MTDAIELGLDTFGDLTLDAAGNAFHTRRSCVDVVDEAVLADQVGLAFIGLGEHHRRDFSISAPEVLGRGDCRTHEADSHRVVGDGAELGRSGPRLRTTRGHDDLGAGRC